ncbi:MAG: hypothetical protein ACM3U2_04395, partial [Deltaproteobacteria bacterium]
MNLNRFRILALVLLSLVAAPPLLPAEPPIAELLKLHTQEARAYRVFRDEKQTQELEFNAKPVFNWTNVVGEHTQFGHLFVWTNAGRPEAVGTIFSTRASDSGRRMLVHEFHTLSTGRLFPVTPENSRYRWTPERGITLTECEDAPRVADAAGQRLAQIRNVARSFSAQSRSREGQTWELRLLPTPLLRYEAPAAQVLDGALFAMVSSAGTDPEVLLLIEARHPKDDDKSWKWHAAAVRFSDKDLTVRRNDKSLWSSLDDGSRRADINADYTLI